MPDNSRLAKLIEQRKRQEKQNDRIRLHKNKLDYMRLAKLSSYYDRNKQILKHQHLTAEAKCVKKLENLYSRQCKIDDEKKEKEELMRRASEERGGEVGSSPPQRRRVTSASKQERSKNFMTKAKTLSSGYRDNDPPQSYYKRKGLVPPDRLVTPEVSFSAQAQTGGGFTTPAAALHVKDMKRWHGIPADIPTAVQLQSRGSEEALALSSAPDTPPPETRELNLIDALRKLEGEDSLGVLQEEDEITSEESSGNGKDADSSRDVVHIRPSTAPAPRPNVTENINPPISARDQKNDYDSTRQPERGTLLRTMLRRPTTAQPHLATQDEHVLSEQSEAERQQSAVSSTQEECNNNQRDKLAELRNLQMRRKSSAISFGDLPEGRRRSSVGPAMAQLHRRQSNVAAIQRSIKNKSALLNAKSNKMKRKSGKRMGLIQSVMTNVENDVLVRKLKEKSECLAKERSRRMLIRAKSAPISRETIRNEETHPDLKDLSEEYAAIWSDRRQKNKGQKVLIEANLDYSKRLSARVRTFLQIKNE